MIKRIKPETLAVDEIPLSAEERERARIADSEWVTDAQDRLSADLQALKRDGWGVYRQAACLWMAIDRHTAGTKRNRLELGKAFRELRHIYSERNIGGNRRTSGHGTFEKECLDRGYPPRTVRGLIADYESILKGTFTEAQKRTERTKVKSAKSPTVDKILVDLESFDVSALKAIRAKVDEILADRQRWTTPHMIETKEGLAIQ